MSNPIRWGILGAGKFARQQMGPALHAAQGAELVALGTSSPDKAAPFLAFAPQIAVHDSYESVLADDTVDAVYVPLPNHLHIEWAEKALQAGKHVLVEKPVGMTAAQIEPLIARRDAGDLQVAEAFMIAHHPQWHRARHLIADGAIGDLCHVDGFFSYNNPDDTNVRFDAAKGGGSLPDIGVYTIGSTLMATGKNPLEITHTDIDFENGVDISARVSARFDGFTAHWVTSMRTHAAQHMTFHGTHGRIHLTAPFNAGGFGEAQLRLNQADGSERIERWPQVRQYELQVEAFCAAIRGEASFAWTLEDAAATQTVIDVVYAKDAAR